MTDAADALELHTLLRLIGDLYVQNVLLRERLRLLTQAPAPAANGHAPAATDRPELVQIVDP